LSSIARELRQQIDAANARRHSSKRSAVWRDAHLIIGTPKLAAGIKALRGRIRRKVRKGDLPPHETVPEASMTAVDQSRDDRAAERERSLRVWGMAFSDQAPALVTFLPSSLIFLTAVFGDILIAQRNAWPAMALRRRL